MGGHQAVEWAIMEPERIRNLCLLATSAVISPWANAFNHTQRSAIETDPTWKQNIATAGEEGMKVARAIALLSYRNSRAYNNTQGEKLVERIYPSRAGSYQDYQGKKLAARFNAFSYWHVSKAMDSQNVGRGRAGIAAALATITARTLVISLESDLLFPTEEQQLLAGHIPDAQHNVIPSVFGHDGFLIETEKIAEALEAFLEKEKLEAINRT
jgi:homoserine O-acetyltransferase